MSEINTKIDKNWALLKKILINLDVQIKIAAQSSFRQEEFTLTNPLFGFTHNRFVIPDSSTLAKHDTSNSISTNKLKTNLLRFNQH